METTMIQEKVKHLAYELYLKRGGIHGNDQEDWFKAEQEIMKFNDNKKKELRRKR